MQYRVGALGFFQPADGVTNLGILDQVAALKWVSEEIAEGFGGDPDNVTVRCCCHYYKHRIHRFSVDSSRSEGNCCRCLG